MVCSYGVTIVRHRSHRHLRAQRLERTDTLSTSCTLCVTFVQIVKERIRRRQRRRRRVARRRHGEAFGLTGTSPTLSSAAWPGPSSRAVCVPDAVGGGRGPELGPGGGPFKKIGGRLGVPCRPRRRMSGAAPSSPARVHLASPRVQSSPARDNGAHGPRPKSSRSGIAPRLVRPKARGDRPRYCPRCGDPVTGAGRL